MPLISIVIPVYNSAKCIKQLHQEICNALKSIYDFEIILVDDKSTDSSWKVITDICNIDKRVVGVCLRKNAGQDNAILAGLRLVSGEYVVIMDDDLQHNPKDISTLYEHCKQGYDVCYARFIDKKQSIVKNIGSWLNGQLSEWVLSKPNELYLSPFKIMKKDIATEIIQFSGAYPYIDGIILTITSNITQLDIVHQERLSGKGNYSLKKSIAVFLKHSTGFSVYPLRIASLVGFYSAIISFIVGGYYLYEYFYTEHKVEGWISIIILLIFFGGLILMSLGLIGEYVGRMYLTLNKKPQYTIDKIVRNNESFAKENKLPKQ